LFLDELAVNEAPLLIAKINLGLGFCTISIAEPVVAFKPIPPPAGSDYLRL
jgi:hypothetical protein